MDVTIQPILEKALAGQRLDFDDGLTLYKSHDLLSIGNAADLIRQRLHPEGYVTYIVDRNINYTNWCYIDCDFCAFYRHKTDPDAYVISRPELRQKIEETLDLGGVQILLQGGLHPTLKLDWYEDLLRWIKSNYDIHIHGFSPPELDWFAKINKISLQETLIRLRDAGLGSIPGGGAEILTNHARDEISPKKCTADEWLEVMQQGHLVGLRSSATMMYGHVESYGERVEHLIRLRQLQDETGGFTAFICWSLQPDHTKLAHLPPTGSFDYLKTLAISRLILDNFDNFQSSWVTQGPKIGQLSLKFGANDMGGTMIEENVVSQAGTIYCMPIEEIHRVVGELGFVPKQRNFFYQIIN
ncbi:MAG: cyclic dehypoxanthinyl futalosine synthase [Candidatus Poribacteria bacterium]|nr:cyclic dehypoxanthinyl futalosine synthase [Candidatus Poribacteria bacterium]